MGRAGGRVSRKPLTENVSPWKTTRSPVSAWRRNCAISRTRVAGRANTSPFQDSTIGWEPADPQAEAPRRDLGDAGSAHGQRRRATREDVGDRRAQTHGRRGPDDGEGREAVHAV